MATKTTIKGTGKIDLKANNASSAVKDRNGVITYTQKTTPTKSSTGKEEPVRRYTQTPYEEAMGSAPKDFTDKDADKLRRDRYKQAQGQIDSINEVFDQKLASARTEGVENLGRTRAVTSRGGLTGSGRGEAQMTKTKEYNRGLESDVEGQRMEKVNTIFADIDRRADTEIEARRAEARGDKETYVNFLKTQSEDSKQQMNDLAGLGVTLDELAPEDKEDFLKYTGMDEMTFTTMWNHLLPKEAKTDYKYEVTDRGIVAYGINPKTGELDTKTFSMPSELMPGEKLQEFNGILYGVTYGADGKAVLRPLASKPKDSGITVTGTYTPGADPVVDSWVAQIKAGKTKISSVPKEYKNKVIVALEQATGASLSSDIETADEIVRLAKELRDDTDTLGNVVGPLSSKYPTLRGDSATYKAKVNRLKALISKANLATMRGLGSMSNIEFENMQAIGSALGVEIGEAGFTEELNRIIDTNEASVKDARKNATGVGASEGGGEVTAENVEAYLDENPEIDAMIQSALQENPDMTDEEILYLINGKGK